MDERTPPAAEQTPGLGHNNPPSPYDERAARTSDLVETGEAWKKVEQIESQEQAERCNDLLALVAAAAKANQEELSKEVDPLKEQVAEISGRYKRLGAAANLSGLAPDSFLGVMAGVLKKLKAGWLERLERQKKEDERKARQAAEEAARAAEEAARQATTIADQIAAEDARKAADDAAHNVEVVAQRRVAVGGEVATRATGFRSVWKATAITNLDDAIARYKTRPEMQDLLLKLASAEARAGRRRIPGFKIEKVRSV